MATWKIEMTALGRFLASAWWLGPVAIWLADKLPVDWTVKELRPMTPEEQAASDARKASAAQ